MAKELLFSVTKKDFRLDYYKGSGKGGQKRNKTENCCRVTHLDSRAVGKSEEGRSKEHNKELAFKRCVGSDIFQAWLKLKTSQVSGDLISAEEWVDDQMRPENIKVDYLGK